MRNILISYPKSGQNRLELLCLLYLTKYIGTDSPLGWNWLKYWCRFTHFGYHNINIPDLPTPEGIAQFKFPKGSTIAILTRDPVAILCSMYRWYQKFPPEHDVFKTMLRGGMTLDEFVLSDWGMIRLYSWNQRLCLLREIAEERRYTIGYYPYEQSFSWEFIQLCIPEILNLKYQLEQNECEWIIEHSSVEYVRGLLAGADRPADITPDIIAGLKIGMKSGHIQVGDPEGHKGRLSPEVEGAVRNQLREYEEVHP